MYLQTLHDIPHNCHAMSMPPGLPATFCFVAAWRMNNQDDPNDGRRAEDDPDRTVDKSVIALHDTALLGRRERLVPLRRCSSTNYAPNDLRQRVTMRPLPKQRSLAL